MELVILFQPKFYLILSLKTFKINKIVRNKNGNAVIAIVQNGHH